MKRPSFLLLFSAMALLASCGGSPTPSSSKAISSTPAATSSAAPVTTSSEAVSSQEATSEQSSVASSSEATSSAASSSAEASSQQSSSAAQSSSEPVGPIVVDRIDSVQDCTILHAWNWKVEKIISELDSIADAGFRAIQLSPMQPSEGASGNWKSQWWKLYQPFGFSVAGSNQNPLGDKTKLAELCTKAKVKKIRIVMDVVCNHLANGGSSDNPSLRYDVRNYEQQIYDQNMIHSNTSRQRVYQGGCDDNNPTATVWGHIGLPDLDTGDSHIQSRALSMLKEYVDCGVSGFRFDAAKHIETEEDSGCGSDFWPNVIGGLKSYGLSKLGEEPYVYGEILNTPGNGRNYGSYTKRMSLCDNKQGEEVLGAVLNNNPGNAAGASFRIGFADKAVLWAESHDTYANDSGFLTHGYGDDVINRTYAIQASRKDAASLYFVRPTHGYDTNAGFGEVSNFDYKGSLVKGVNQFHNLFVDATESQHNVNGTYVNVRAIEGAYGAMIVGNTSGSITIPNLPDGSYKDLITGTAYTVSNHAINASSSSGVIALSNVDPSGLIGPAVNLSADKTVFADKANVTISCPDATSATYTINGGSPITFNKSASFPVGENLPEGDIVIVVKARNAKGETVSTLTLTKTSLANKNFIVFGVPADKDAAVWAWNDTSDGHWVTLSRTGNTVGTDLTDANFLVALFDKGDTPDWGRARRQTHDMEKKDTNHFSYDELPWKN